MHVFMDAKLSPYMRNKSISAQSEHNSKTSITAALYMTELGCLKQ